MRRPDDVRARRSHERALSARGSVSLARALSKLGVTSRREAERWIRAGRVRVNGREALDPRRWVLLSRDRVVVDGRVVGEDAARVVIAFHKPRGCVTTRVDPGDRATVYDVLGDVGRWVFPVGRLDRDTSGLLVLTNDHRLGHHLTEPEHRVPKTYHARVRGVPDPVTLRVLREGVPLDDGEVTRPARVRVLGVPPRGADSTWLEIVLEEGRNRQVRRMAAAVGHAVIDLVRVRIGQLTLGDMAPGEWRELKPAEVALLAGRAWARASGGQTRPKRYDQDLPGRANRLASRSERNPRRTR